MKYVILLAALFLAGCANMPKPTITAAPVQHHQVAKPASKTTAKPPAVAKAPEQPTLRERGLHVLRYFLRERTE